MITKKGTRHRLVFISKRLLKFSIIVGSVGGSIYYIHEKDILYNHVIERMKKNKGKATLFNEKKNNYMYYWILSAWGWSRSWEPIRFLKYIPDLMEFTKPEYPKSHRNVALMIFSQILSTDSNMPRAITYDKAVFKKKILGSDYSDKLMQTLYNLSADVKEPELMMLSLDIITKFTVYPIYANGKISKSLMRACSCTREIAEISFLRAQSFDGAKKICNFLIEKNCRRFHHPLFLELKRLLIEKKVLKFALRLWLTGSNVYKQTAFQIVPMLINEYPDLNELSRSLGDTDDEKSISERTIEEILLHVGQTHYMRNENEAALKCFEESLKFGSPNILVLYFLGLVNKELGHIDTAENNFSLSLDLSNGQFSDARLELSNLLLRHKKLDDYEEAIQHLIFLTNEKQHPKINEIYFRLLFALEEMKQYELALKYMKKFTKMKPNNIQGLFEVGRIANLVGEFKLSNKYLKKVLAREPMNTSAKYQLALSCYGLNDSTKEINKLLNEILKQKDDVKALQLKYKIAFNEEDYKEALKIVNIILLQKRSSVLFYNQKAKVLELTNDENIFRIYRKIISIWESRMTRQDNYFSKFPNEYQIYKKLSTKSKEKKSSIEFEKFKVCFLNFEKNIQRSKYKLNKLKSIKLETEEN